MKFFRRTWVSLRGLAKNVLDELVDSDDGDATILPTQKRFEKMRSNSAALGAAGEEAAAEFLRKMGYEILDRNLILPSCEIDLIARDTGMLVFVEVKSRRDESFIDAIAAVDASRKKRMMRAADEYRRWKNSPAVPTRFDLITVVGRAGSAVENSAAGLKITHISNAFGPFAGEKKTIE